MIKEKAEENRHNINKMGNTSNTKSCYLKTFS